MGISNLKVRWILKNKLAIGKAPRTNADLNFLYNFGIKSVLSLCSYDEAPLEIDSRFRHIRFVLPDHRSDQLLNQKHIFDSLKFIDELLNNSPLYIHCLAGVERSPLICMAWLMKTKNLTFQESFEYLVQVNPSTNPLPELFISLRDIKFS